jgi:hypothetical protein
MGLRVTEGAQTTLRPRRRKSAAARLPRHRRSLRTESDAPRPPDLEPRANSRRSPTSPIQRCGLAEDNQVDGAQAMTIQKQHALDQAPPHIFTAPRGAKTRVRRNKPRKSLLLRHLAACAAGNPRTSRITPEKQPKTGYSLPGRQRGLQKCETLPISLRFT